MLCGGVEWVFFGPPGVLFRVLTGSADERQLALCFAVRIWVVMLAHGICWHFTP